MRAPTHYNCDHVKPKVEGGQSVMENLAVACALCNGQKSMVDAGTAALAKRAAAQIMSPQRVKEENCTYHGSRCEGQHSEVGAIIYDVMFGDGSTAKMDRLAQLL